MPFLIPILTAILPTILPALVKKALPSVVMVAENEMVGAPGAEKKQWVLECFLDIYDVLKAKGVLSDRFDSVFSAIVPKISDWIEDAIVKLKSKGAM